MAVAVWMMRVGTEGRFEWTKRGDIVCGIWYHFVMTRTVVALDNDIKKWIDAKAVQEGVPMTELVRRALQQFREHEEQLVERLLSETSGIWTAGDGLKYQQSLRDEWGQ